MEELLAFLRGAPWDVDDDVRLVAISTSGEYLREHSEPQLLRELLRIVGNDEDRDLLRKTAYNVLARAVGRAWLTTSWWAPIDPSVVEEAEQRLAVQGG